MPALLAVAGGAAQSTPVGQPFPSALTVVARDVNGTPMPGILVMFSPPVSGASASLGALQVYTDSSGEATTTASANLVFGTYQVTASAAGLGTTANFPLTNLAAILQIGATIVDFGLVPVGSRSSRPSSSPMGATPTSTVSAGVLGSTEFSVGGTCSGFVGPGDTCHVIVTYTPAVDGLAGGAVQFPRTGSSRRARSRYPGRAPTSPMPTVTPTRTASPTAWMPKAATRT